MRLRSITPHSIVEEVANDVQITYYDPDGDDWDIEDQAIEIANRSGIRISRDKELTFVALLGEEVVVGAVWSAFAIDQTVPEEYGEVWRYDFDVAVDPAHRASGLRSRLIGPKLIDAAIADYESRKGDVDNAYIRCWVVNPKLAKWLEARRGFETEGGSEWHPSDPYMVYY